MEQPALRSAPAEGWSQPSLRLHGEGGRVDSIGCRYDVLTSPFQNSRASCRRRQRQQAAAGAARSLLPHSCFAAATQWMPHAGGHRKAAAGQGSSAAAAILNCRITPARPETLGRGRAAAVRLRKANADDPFAQITLRAVRAVEANGMVGGSVADQCLSACVLIRQRASAWGQERWLMGYKAWHSSGAMVLPQPPVTLTPHSAVASALNRGRGRIHKAHEITRDPSQVSSAAAAPQRAILARHRVGRAGGGGILFTAAAAQPLHAALHGRSQLRVGRRSTPWRASGVARSCTSGVAAASASPPLPPVFLSGVASASLPPRRPRMISTAAGLAVTVSWGRMPGVIRGSTQAPRAGMPPMDATRRSRLRSCAAPWAYGVPSNCPPSPPAASPADAGDCASASLLPPPACSSTCRGGVGWQPRQVRVSVVPLGESSSRAHSHSAAAPGVLASARMPPI